MMKTNFFSKALAIAMMLLGLTFVSCDEYDNPLPADWDGSSPNLPLTLEAVNEGATMNVTFTSTLPETTTIEYSTDGGKSWRFFTISGGKPYYQYGDPTNPTIQNENPYIRTISGVHQILFRGYNESYGSKETYDLHDDYILGSTRNLTITVDADCYIYGNMMSLVDGDNYATRTDLKKDYTFSGMFCNHSANLKNHPTKKLLLPATTLTEGCYESMFAGCLGITVAPDLPATTLTSFCYHDMFYDTGLKVAPSLPATTLAEWCYYEMFAASQITTAPELPATTLANNCYNAMFRGCTALTTAPEKLPATTLADFCYSNMFKNCSALTTAPKELPATTLAKSCYQEMFNGCTALTTAPALPATTLVENCYYGMFMSCSNLNYIKCLATTGADCATALWVYYVPAGTGRTFVVADKTKYGAGLFWDPNDWGFSGDTKCMAPTGWTAKNPDEE